MKFLVLEDEPLIAKRLKRMIENAAGDKAFETIVLHQLDEAIELIKTQKIDLCFLDLNLSGKNGFDLLTNGNNHFQTIITSSHGEKALEAFNYEVLDFVPKPFKPERLKQALNRYFKQYSVQSNSLLVECNGQQKVVAIDDISYIKAAGNYSQVECINGKQHLHTDPIGTLEERLQSCFIRVHKSFLVPHKQIAGLKNHGGGKYELVLNSEQTLPVSRSQYANLQALLNST
ncbi:MAG: LytTR family DNA-binding domain-containing protein [bacterium]|nr:LytTR family DNA-binding domain-containing protein [bacterium]